MPMTLTKLFIRTGGYGETQTHPVIALACVRLAGHTFLVHRDYEDPSRYRCTYAPLGLSAGGKQPSIEASIQAISSQEITLADAIKRSIEHRQKEYEPLYSGEEGIETDDWRLREQWRFDTGDYRPIPIGLDYPKDHYAHLSTDKPDEDFIAYTPSDEYGRRDRQVRLRFGRYLKKTFPDMNDAEIQKFVARLRSKLESSQRPSELHFATDTATINEIFETRMYARDSDGCSCMYGKFADDEIRPYHVYANSPDVALAYLTRHGDIVARSVVSTKDKTWIRPYSIEPSDSALADSLIDALEAAGYSKGSLNGNRLSILNTSEVMLPYIDGSSNDVTEKIGYWVVTDDGDYTADRTDGSATDNRTRCPECRQIDDECECSSCECCGRRSNDDGCEHCTSCQQCDGCREHDGCNCDRCEECDEIISPSSRYVNSCQCDRCDECHALTNECECEEETEEETEEQEAAA